MRFIRNFFIKTGFLIIFNQSNGISYELFGTNISSNDDIALLTIIRVLINPQIFGLRVIENSSMITENFYMDSSSSASDLNDDRQLDAEDFSDSDDALPAPSGSVTPVVASIVPIITTAADSASPVPNTNTTVASAAHAIAPSPSPISPAVTTAASVSSSAAAAASASPVTNTNTNTTVANAGTIIMAANLSFFARNGASLGALASYFVNKYFTAAEIASLKSIDREIIDSMDRIWGKIEDSPMNKEYIQACLEVVKRTWRFHPNQIRVDLSMDEIVKCLYIAILHERLVSVVSSTLQQISEKSFKTALEIFAELNKDDLVMLYSNKLSNYINNGVMSKIISKAYEIASNDIINIAFMINIYLYVFLCNNLPVLEGFYCFKTRSSSPKYYKFFYDQSNTMRLMPVLHCQEGLGEVVTIKFGPLRELISNFGEPMFIELIQRGKKNSHYYHSEHISFFKELGIPFIDIKSARTPSAQYRRYVLKNGEYYDISNGAKLPRITSFDAIREKDDAVPKIIY